MKKFYSIQKIFGSWQAENPIVEHWNSKKALEKLIGRETVRQKSNIDINCSDYSVVECDKEGRLHFDRRKWIYYKIKKYSNEKK